VVNKSSIQSKTTLTVTQKRDKNDDDDNNNNSNNNNMYGDRGGENIPDWRRTWCKTAK
jgi:hypothetical protein